MVLDGDGHAGRAAGHVGDAAEDFDLHAGFDVFDPQQGSLKLIKNKKPLTESAPELASMTAKLPGNEKGKFSSEKELIDLFIRLNSQ